MSSSTSSRAGAAFVRTKTKNVITGSVVETSYNPTAKFPQAFIERREVTYSYEDGDLYHFMDVETYDDIPVGAADVPDNFKFCKENDTCKLLSYKGKVFSVEIPNFVELEVTATEPGVKGNTATNTLKPATVETGAEIRVPPVHQRGRQDPHRYPHRRVYGARELIRFSLPGMAVPPRPAFLTLGRILTMAMDLNAKAAYIRGLMTGMDFDADSKNGKVIAAMMDLLEEMAAQVTEHDNALDQVYDELETLDQDLDDVVSDIYADEDEDDEEDAEDDSTMYEVTCPNCGQISTLDEETLMDPEGAIWSARTAARPSTSSLKAPRTTLPRRPTSRTTKQYISVL